MTQQHRPALQPLVCKQIAALFTALMVTSIATYSPAVFAQESKPATPMGGHGAMGGHGSSGAAGAAVAPGAPGSGAPMSCGMMAAHHGGAAGRACGMHAAAQSARINLEHQAQQEVSNDLASITLFAEFKDKEASAASQRAAISTQQALARLQSDTSITEKRSSLQTWNDYGPDGKVSGWRARAEIVIEGKDFAALGRAASRLSSDFAYAGVSYRLSHEARQREEQALMARAIAAWREKAQTVVSALGYSGGFDAAEVTVRTSSDSGLGNPQMRMAQPMMMASSAEGAPAAALEGGRSKVTVTVSGAVRAK